jgi:hypothetical protein
MTGITWKRGFKEERAQQKSEVAGLDFGVLPNLCWLFTEQPKVFLFNEVCRLHAFYGLRVRSLSTDVMDLCRYAE